MIKLGNIAIIIFLTLTIIGCGNNHHRLEKDIQQYVIKKAKHKVNIDSITENPIPFIKEFYFDYNIILVDTLRSIYFHEKRFYCLTGSDVWNNSLPIFRNLKPDYFEKEDKIELVLNRIIKSKKEIERVYLISNKDTISDDRYFELKQKLIENKIGVSTRLMTEEEIAVLSSILENRKHNPIEVDWKSTLHTEFENGEEFEITDDLEIEEINNTP